jgi:hypothetical protein
MLNLIELSDFFLIKMKLLNFWGKNGRKHTTTELNSPKHQSPHLPTAKPNTTTPTQADT